MEHRIQQAPGSPSRKRRALLAGGAILGLGAAATLATWSDDVWVGASFNTDTFNIQGFTGATGGWGDHPTDASAAVFQPETGMVVPGSTNSYSILGLRMGPGSTVGATVTIPAGAQLGSGTQANKFRMRVLLSESGDCNASSFASSSAQQFVVGGSGTYGTMLSAPTGISTVSLNTGLAPSAPGTPVYLCYEFSLPSQIPDGLANGDTAAVRWTFNAESSS